MTMTQKNEALALETLSQMEQGQIEAMSFKELDEFVDAADQCIAFHQTLHRGDIIKARRAMRPAIWRVHLLLSHQGMRTDLLDVPAELTFDAWVRSKAHLGSRSTIYRLLATAGIEQEKPLAKGARVKVAGKGATGVVTHVHEVDGGVPKVDVLFDGEKKAATCDAEELVKVTVRKIAKGGLFVFEDEKGVEYRYKGGRTFVPTATSSKAGQKKPCGTAKAGQEKAAAAGQRV
jgi:hypothetical protein